MPELRQPKDRIRTGDSGGGGDPGPEVEERPESGDDGAGEEGSGGPSGRSPLPPFSHDRTYGILRRIQDGLVRIDRDPQKAIRQIPDALYSARVAEGRLQALLETATEAASRARVIHREARRVLKLQMSQALRDPKQKDIQEVPQSRRKEVAEALFWRERDVADGLQDDADEWKSFQDVVKGGKERVLHYRQDIDKFLRWLEENRRR